MRAAKNIDDLFTEVRNFDLVLTNDAPLATALNAKIDRPMIGGFAYTPRQIAAQEQIHVLGRGTLTDLQLIAAIADETGYDLKFIHSEVQNIRQIRAYTQDVERYLYTKRSHNVYHSFVHQPTIERIMDGFDAGKSDFFADKKVAVIGLELFDDLDKHFIPPQFTEIDIFKKGKNCQIDTVYAVGNDRQIADSAVDLIDASRVTDTAIVMDAQGSIADAVRAALYRKKLPFKNSLTVRDLSQVRDFIQFLTLAIGFDTTRVGDVRELFSAYGARERPGFNGQADNYLLGRTQLGDRPDAATAGLIDLMRRIGDLTFGEVAEQVTAYTPRQRPALILLLEDLRLTDTKVTPELVNTVAYAVNNISDLRQNEQIPEEEKHGVLLADCHRSVYVDRPFVIYLGLDDAWTDRTALGQDYIDPEDQEEKNAVRLTVLLQQGTARVYAVRPVTNGRETCPCQTFERAEKDAGTPRPIATFGDLCTKLVHGTWHTDAPLQMPQRCEVSLEAAADLNWQFSKSTYDHYADCPRAFLFSELLPTPDSDRSAFGNYLHEFAEFYLCYPETVREKGLDHYLDWLDRVYSGISSSCLKETDRSRFRICLTNLIRYIDRVRPAQVPLDKENTQRPHPNALMSAENCSHCSSLAETELQSGLHSIFGKFDMLADSSVVDYKTGKPKTVKQIGQALDPDYRYNKEFQPLIYLALLQEHLRKQKRTDDVSFQLLYVTDNLVASATDQAFDIDANTRTVRLTGRSQDDVLLGAESVLKKELTAKTYDGLVNCWESFTAAIQDFQAKEDRLCTENDASAIAAALHFKKKTEQKMVTGALKKLTKLRAEPLIPSDPNTITVTALHLDKFLAQVDRDHQQASVIRQRSLYGCPFSPTIGCQDCIYFKACTDPASDHENEDPQEADE